MRRYSLILLACAAMLTVLAPGASGATWCLNSSTCGAGGNNFPMNQTGLEQAIATADLNPGFDKIEIGAGTIEISSTVNVTSTAINELAIEGVGNGNTYIHSSMAEGYVLEIDATGAGVDAIRGVKFQLDGTPTATRNALHLINASVQAVTFDVHGTGEFASYGLRAATSTCSGCDFNVSGDQAYGALADYGAEFSASRFTSVGAATDDTTGLASSGGTTLVKNSVFSGFATTVTNDGGVLDIRDSLIDLGARANAKGVIVANGNPNDLSLSGRLNGVTIFGSGSGQTGFSMTGAATQTVNWSIKNSLLMLTGVSSIAASCNHMDSSTTVLDLAFVMLNGGAASKNAGCTGNTGSTWDSIDQTPSTLFVDAAAGDFRLMPGASVIDRGDPSEPPADHVADAAMLSRFVDGTGSGNPTIDLGAYEYQTPVPVAPQDGGADGTPQATPVTFSKFSGRIKFKSRKGLKDGFALTRQKPTKPRVKVRGGHISEATLRLYRGGKPLKGSQKLTIPEGTSYLVFRGKWNRKVLPTGSYTLRITVDNMPNRLSMSVTLPRQDR